MGGFHNPFGMMFSSVLSIDLDVITAFAGSIGNIPPGWFLCNGANGTPDLRDKFIVGAGSSFSVGDEGGETTHLHDFTGTGHIHVMGSAEDINTGADKNDEVDSGQGNGTTEAVANLPKYYALAYIQYKGT